MLVLEKLFNLLALLTKTSMLKGMNVQKNKNQQEKPGKLLEREAFYNSPPVLNCLLPVDMLTKIIIEMREHDSYHKF
jgi:hypothetical protein